MSGIAKRIRLEARQGQRQRAAQTEPGQADRPVVLLLEPAQISLNRPLRFFFF